MPFAAESCIEALIFSFTAGWVRNALISGSAISAEWRTL
jgi:hypothetical protein